MAAPSVTQAVKVEASTGTSATLNSAITWVAGRLAVANVTAWNGTPANFSVTDTVNASYTGVTGYAGGGATVRFFYKANISSGLANLTATGGTGASGVVGIWHEVSGAATTAPATGTDTGGSGTTTIPISGTITTADAEAIVFAATSTDQGANPSTITLNGASSNPASGWAHFSANSFENNGASYVVCSVPTVGVTSTGSYQHRWGSQADITNWAAAIIAFKAAAGGGPAAPSVPMGTLGLLGVGR